MSEQTLKRLESEGVVVISGEYVRLNENFDRLWRKHLKELSRDPKTKDPYGCAVVLAYLDWVHPSPRTKKEIIDAALVLSTILKLKLTGELRRGIWDVV